MSMARGNVRVAIDTVRATRWRSVLTMFGVIVGIVSVVMVVGIGEGVKREVARQINQFGEDLITVRPGGALNDGGLSTAQTDLLFGLSNVGGLTEKDLETVRAAQHVRLSAPLSIVPGSVESSGTKLENSLVIATNADLPFVLNRNVAYGDFFDERGEQGSYAVIGQAVAQTLFEDPAPLGQSLTFRGRSFIVRGVLDEFQTSPMSPTADLNHAIFIPFTTAKTLDNVGGLQIYSILAKPDKMENLKAAMAAIDKGLFKNHGGERDYDVLDQEKNLAASSGVLSLITALIAAVAGISLVVGGVGVMNIMLASVTERTHEIGVRKAVGATNRQILNQFLLESMVLSLTGGIIGILTSLATVLLLNIYTDLKPIVSWEAVAVATGVSLLIGMVFGVVPALKAAHKDPIDALRYE